MSSEKSSQGEPQYEISRVVKGWRADETLYRRVITREGEQIVEKGVDGRYVHDHGGEGSDK